MKQLGLLTNGVNSVDAFKQLLRKFHLSKTLKINPSNVTEVKIPVPWGHIAGKWWGDTNKQPILALHGWQDNAGSFDPLIELLPNAKPVLAIDSPGHGFSSHYPEGMIYHNANYVMVCRRVMKYFKWDNQITLLGHSEGGVIAFLFAAIYPDMVNGLITLDAIKPYSLSDERLLKMGKMIDDYITKSRRNQNENTKYSLDEIQNRWLAGTKGSLTSDAVKVLMKRGIKFDQQSGKYFYSRDPKVKIHSLQLFNENQSLELARNLNCHYLVIRCSEGKFIDYALKNSPSFLTTVNEAAKSFKMITVEGTHHVHLTNPERVLPIVKDFVEKVYNT